MEFSFFKKILTTKDLAHHINLMKSISEEKFIPMESLLKVTGTPYENLRYNMSTSKNGFISHHWFVYEVDGFVGLLFSYVGSDKLVKITEPIYSEFIVMHNCMWLARCKDTSIDVYVYNRLVLCNVTDYDVLDVGGYLNFVQLDTADFRCLVCCDNTDLNYGIFVPKDFSAFEEYYTNRIATLGYSGKLDELPLSSIIQIYYEVKNCIFNNSVYKYLDC